jgi:predicted ester cyclase
VRRLYEEAYGEGKVQVVDEVLYPDFVCYDPNSETGEVRGAETVKGEIEYFRSAGLSFAVDAQIAEGDKVVTRLTAAGTRQGEFFGIAPTGKRIEMTGISIERFDEGGKLVEEWPEYNLLGVLRQLEAAPKPKQTTGVQSSGSLTFPRAASA